jgi:hypothetical protein
MVSRYNLLPSDLTAAYRTCSVFESDNIFTSIMVVDGFWQLQSWKLPELLGVLSKILKLEFGIHYSGFWFVRRRMNAGYGLN